MQTSASPSQRAIQARNEQDAANWYPEACTLSHPLDKQLCTCRR